MPSHETFGGQPERYEAQPNSYAVAARFERQSDAGSVYEMVQECIFDAKCDLSVYRLQLDSVWHVAALGEPPPSDVDREIRDQLSRGELTRLPDVVVDALLERRAQANRIGPWVEGHYR
jgi:hypothetical protein